MATLSQQLTWSHLVELLPIEDELKRDFYAALCKNENWSVRTLRERKKSMLYERTAISRMPEETIANEIAELRAIDCKMLYLSTDYVFDGQGTEPWKPDSRRFLPGRMRSGDIWKKQSCERMEQSPLELLCGGLSDSFGILMQSLLLPVLSQFQEVDRYTSPLFQMAFRPQAYS